MINGIQDQENNVVVGPESAYRRPREEILLKVNIIKQGKYYKAK